MSQIRYPLQYLSVSQNKSLSPFRGPQWLISSPGSNKRKLIIYNSLQFSSQFTCWLRSSICANIGPSPPPGTGADTFLWVTPGSKQYIVRCHKNMVTVFISLECRTRCWWWLGGFLGCLGIPPPPLSIRVAPPPPAPPAAPLPRAIPPRASKGS